MASQHGRHDRREKHEIHKAQGHGAERQGRTHENEIDVSEGPDESEQDAKPDAEGGAQPRIAQVQAPRFKDRWSSGSIHSHRLGSRNGEINEHSAHEIETRKEIEIGSEPQVIGDASRDEPPDEIASDVAGDVGRKCAAGVRGAAYLA